MAEVTSWHDLLVNVVNAVHYLAETGDRHPLTDAMTEAEAALEAHDIDAELDAAIARIGEAERSARRDTVI